MPRNFIEKLTDAVTQLRDPIPQKMLGDIETKAAQVRADERPDYGRAQGWSDYYWTQWPNYRSVDRRQDLGRLDGSSLVMAVANYTGISLAEALPVVTKPDGKGAQQVEPEHIAADLIRRPNPFSIWADYCLMLGFEWWMGNFYLKKVRNIAGQIVELWHIPHFLVQPRWPGDGGTPTVPLEEADNTFLTHFQYNQPGKAPVLIKRADMVHIKRGVCADNPRKGAGVWDGVLEELYGDNAVARFSAQIMKNMGMVQVMLSPKDGASVTPEQAAHIKQRWIQLSTGDNANQPMVNPVPIDVEKLGFSPDELDLSKLRNVPESRIAGVTGIPAIVLQYIVGLENGHYGAAYEQARQQGYECLPSEARVWTDNGPVPIGDIEPGDSVWSFSDGGLDLRPVIAKGSSGFKQIYQVRTINRLLRASGDHKVLVRKAGSCYGERISTEWKRVADLTTDDMLVEPKGLPDQGKTEDWNGNTVTPDLMQFLGAYAGDGWMHQDNGIGISMPEQDRVREHYEALAIKLFTKQSKVGVSRNKCVDGSTESMLAMVASGETRRETARLHGISHGALQSRFRHYKRALPDVPTYEPVKPKTQSNSFVFYSQSAVRMLRAMGFAGKAKTKRVPGWVFGLRCDLRLAFLAGIVDSDGTIGKNCSLRVTFANRLLMLDVRDLLISVGMQCGAGVRKVQSNAHFGSAVRSLESEVWTLQSSARDLGEIPFADQMYRERIANDSRTRPMAGGSDAPSAGLSEHLGFYKVTAIDRLDVVEMFDIQVADSQSFIADGVVVHNSVIIPIQSHLSEDLTWQVLPEIDNTKGARLSFDITKVRVLQDDRTELYSRMVEAVRAGVITINQFLVSVGKEPVAEGEIYLIPSTSTPMTIDRIKTIADGTVEPPPVVTPEPAKMAADIDHLLAELERQMKDFTPRT